MPENKARYDVSVKEVLADKQVLARILKYSLDEFKDDSVAKSSEEDTVPGEGMVIYDI